MDFFRQQLLKAGWTPEQVNRHIAALRRTDRPKPALPSVPPPVLAESLDVELQSDMSSDEAITLSLESRFAGMYVIGKPGTGKTTFLLSLLRQDMEHGLGLCFLDPHGDASLELLSLAPVNRRFDVRLLDPSDEGHLFGLNPFANGGSAAGIASAADGMVQIFKRAWGGTSWGPKLEDTLFNLSYVMAASGGTLADCPDFFYSESKRIKRLRAVHNRAVVSFWEHEFNELTASGQRETRGTVLNKIRHYLSNPLIEQIVSGKHEQVDFRQAMDRGQILVVRLPVGELGEGPVNLLGSAIVDGIAKAAMSRTDAQNRRPFILCADEFQRFATPTFATLIEEARKYKVATMVAHQRRTQLPEEVRDALMSVRTHVVFEVSGKDAAELSKEFSGDPKNLMTPSDLYAHLERKGHQDQQIMAAFARIRQQLDAYPAQRAHQIRASGKMPDTAMIRLNVEEQKDCLSHYWRAFQDGGGLPRLPLWPQFKDDMLRVGVGLADRPIRVPYRDHQPDENLATLPPFTARVKYRDGHETKERLIRTQEPPKGEPWRPSSSMWRPFDYSSPHDIGYPLSHPRYFEALANYQHILEFKAPPFPDLPIYMNGELFSESVAETDKPDDLLYFDESEDDGPPIFESR